MKTVLRTAGPYVWRYRRGLALGIGALIVKDVLGACLPLVIKYGIDMGKVVAPIKAGEHAHVQNIKTKRW